MRAITAAKTINNAYSNASFSSVTAATKPFVNKDSATTASKLPEKQFESSNIPELGYWAVCGGEERWGCPRTLCARFALQYGRTISKLLPMGL